MKGAPAPDADAIVVGAGPAGAALARRLAGRARVLLLERPARGEDRPAAAWRIGESLPGAAATLLRRSGLYERFLADGHQPRGASVSAWEAPVPVWFDSLRDPNGPGWHLDRLRFDAMLRDAARGTGAALVTLDGRARARREGKVWRVRDEGSGRDYAAPILVDATGRAAALLRGLGIPRHAADRLICAHALLPPAAGDGDRCTRVRADADGWWYSARVPSGGRVLAFHLDADDPDLRGARDAAAFLARARRSPPLDDVLPARIDGTTIHMRPAGGAWSDFDACAREPGLYAVGDACLAFDPLSSQGLFHALASAESAAAAIARRLDGAADADLPFWTEMRNVRARYQAALRDVYARAARFAGRRFWARRNGARVRAG